MPILLAHEYSWRAGRTGCLASGYVPRTTMRAWTARVGRRIRGRVGPVTGVQCKVARVHGKVADVQGTWLPAAALRALIPFWLTYRPRRRDNELPGRDGRMPRMPAERDRRGAVRHPGTSGPAPLIEQHGRFAAGRTWMTYI